MEQIRVKRGIEIGVNDNGDSIILDVENTLFIERYNNLVRKVQKIADSINESEVDDDNIGEYLTAKMTEVVKAIDEVLGKDCCKKVYGKDVVPSPYAIVDFFDQLTPVVERYSNEREKKLTEKYKPRKGGRK